MQRQAKTVENSTQVVISIQVETSRQIETSETGKDDRDRLR